MLTSSCSSSSFIKGAEKEDEFIKKGERGVSGVFIGVMAWGVFSPFFSFILKSIGLIGTVLLLTLVMVCIYFYRNISLTIFF